LRVLAISGNFPHRDDPACGIFAARQFAEMKRQGADVTVMVPVARAPKFILKLGMYRQFRRREFIEYEGLDIVEDSFLRLPGKYSLFFDGFSAYLTIRNEIRRRHKQKPYSVIYARGFWLEADVGIRLGRLLGIPVVGAGIGSDVNVRPDRGRLFHGFFRRIARKLDMTMATGSGVAKKIEAVNGNHTEVMGGVVELDKFVPTKNKSAVRRELGLPEDRKIILFVGHIIKSKGVYELLDAFEAICGRFPQAMLYMCGEGDERGPLMEAVKRRGLAGRVEMPGNILPDMVPKYMQAADVFALPSYNEGMPNVLMEAMACGLPVIATNVGGIPAAVGDGNAAILIEPGNADEIEKTLIRLIEDAQFSQRISVVARKKAEACFGVKQNTRKVVRCLEKAIAQRV